MTAPFSQLAKDVAKQLVEASDSNDMAVKFFTIFSIELGVAMMREAEHKFPNEPANKRRIARRIQRK